MKLDQTLIEPGKQLLDINCDNENKFKILKEMLVLKI